ncbi:thiamine pyrophosphate-dependent enzyme [Natrarchaeobius oligotrophus]|uniref:Pyruvate dehydrogenase (Acetyl-transferring) E1 component subunit alpha n=1 Tax=Natrarchaeobius chitinivorans TaxID=1679083 RepID=A0A3N6MMZ3_NATCH|nr:thiamine pyrophosphate-dependent enzyme [Natrarchaeobius chitinivorans]RQG98820.1 pyruvate dehydrogenase (acetyl-transferring) E1 component subunit alpha [Natrarchaeobius chitinivorans]
MHRAIGERPLAETRVSSDLALELYEDMVRSRLFDERAVSLQRRGWMSGYPPFRGQEASQVGAAHALAGSDWLVPTYRSNAMQLVRGVPMADILLFRRGRPEFASGRESNVFPQAISIASQLPHAVGLGMAAARGDGSDAVCCYFGDGATSEGDFHEALTFAGVFDAPVVFFCENNRWAISTPRPRQTASETIAQKATAYGFEGVRVDGNDPIATYEVVSDALESARAGDPILVESLTYRQGPHTTSDDPSRYRTDEDLPAWRTADPLERFERMLREHDVLADDLAESIRADAEAEIETAIETADSSPEPGPTAVFDSVFADRPPRISAQREWLQEFLERREPDDLETGR